MKKHCTPIILFFIISFILQCSQKKNPLINKDISVPGVYAVKIKNYTHTMWIGSNSDSLAQIMENLVGTDYKRWIGGKVVPDQEMPHGFYFDPNTIVIAEFTVEGMQTTISQIADDPQYFAEHGWSNGLAEHAWYVLGLFIDYKNQN